jgi:hypothetical protein
LREQKNGTLGLATYRWICTTAQPVKLDNCLTGQPIQTVQVHNAEGKPITVQDVFLSTVSAPGTKIDFA